MNKLNKSHTKNQELDELWTSQNQQLGAKKQQQNNTNKIMKEKLPTQLNHEWNKDIFRRAQSKKLSFLVITCS